MAEHKKRMRIGLVTLVAISLLVCPLAAGGFGLPRANAQIRFTPNISPLELTQTAEGPELGEVTPGPWLPSGRWEAGIAFDCPRGSPARCRPALETRTGDIYFGYGEISGSPGLYLIWVTDEEATHYYVVDSTDEGFSSDAIPDDFSDLIASRNEEVSALESARDAADIIASVTGTAVPFLLILCPVTWVTCFGVAAGGVIAAVIGAGTNYNEADHAAERISEIEGNLRGRFGLIVAASQAH